MTYINSRSHILILLLGMLSSLICLSGCSVDKPGNDVTPKDNSGISTATKSKYKIAGIGLQNDQFFKIIEYGMKDSAKKNDVELSLGNSAGALNNEISLLDTYTTKKVDAIVIAPNNAKA